MDHIDLVQDFAEVNFATATHLNTQIWGWGEACKKPLDTCVLIHHFRWWVCYCKSLLPKLPVVNHSLCPKHLECRCPCEIFSVASASLSHTGGISSTAAAGLSNPKLTDNTSYLPKHLPRCFHLPRHLQLNTICNKLKTDLLQTKLLLVQKKIQKQAPFAILGGSLSIPEKKRCSLMKAGKESCFVF